MATLTASSSLQELLCQMRDVTEIRDVQGNFLGIFAPKDQAEEWMYERAKTLFDPAEMTKRIQEEHGRGKTTVEVLKHLQSLEAQA